MRLYHDGNLYYCENDYAERERVKAAGFRYNHDEFRWESIDDLCALKLIEFARGPTLERLEAFRDSAQKAVALSRSEDSDIQIPVPEGLEYLPFQKGGVEYCVEKFEEGACPSPGVLIADQMGL